MAQLIQPLRRSILSKIQILIQHIQIQHQIQKPISCFTHLPSTQPKVRSFSSVGNVMQKTAVETNLLRLLRTEISQLNDFDIQKPPVEFNGFKVEERPGENWISLEKKFGESEEIKVEVTMFDGEAPIPEDGDKSDQPEEEVQLHMTMIISIFKPKTNQILEFICSAWPNTLEVQNFSVRELSKKLNKEPYTGPTFEELDDELQDSLYDFLEERGINDKMCAFLHNFISYKDKAELIRWMQSAKKAIENK